MKAQGCNTKHIQTSSGPFCQMFASSLDACKVIFSFFLKEVQINPGADIKDEKKMLRFLPACEVNLSLVLLGEGRKAFLAVTSGSELPAWLQFLLFCELLPSAEIISPALTRTVR